MNLYARMLQAPQPYMHRLVLLSHPLELRVYVRYPTLTAALVCRDYDVPPELCDRVRVLFTARGHVQPAIPDYQAYLHAFQALATSSEPGIRKILLTSDYHIVVHVTQSWWLPPAIRKTHGIPSHVQLHLDYRAVPSYAPHGALCCTQ